MEVSRGVGPVTFPVYPHGHLCISINFQAKRTGVYLFGLDQSTWQGVMTERETVFGGAFPVGEIYTIFGVPGCELANQIIDLADIWPDKAKVLVECIEKAESLEQRAWVLESFFRSFCGIEKQRNQLVQRVLHALETTPAGKIAKIAENNGVSHRQLVRLFAKHVGLSPKTMGKLYRLRNVKLQMLESPHLDLGDFCYHWGYYDQAHFNHEFREYFGASPAMYLKNGVDLS